MAWTDPSTYVAGAILTAASLNTNVRDNSLAGGPIYASTAARDAAIPSPFAGQRAFVTATNVAYQYSGTAWVETITLGAWTTYVPTLTQGAAVAKTDAYCRYSRAGRTITAQANVTATAIGTAGSTLALGLPVAANAAGVLGSRIGVFQIYDASAVTRYIGIAEIINSTTVSCVTDVSGGSAWGTVPSIAAGVNDQYGIAVTYEAAA